MLNILGIKPVKISEVRKFDESQYVHINRRIKEERVRSIDERLITCDFSCGGMLSHKIYEDYLESVAKKMGSDVGEVNFRPKTYGWSCHAIIITGNNQKSYSRVAVADPYFKCFIGSHVSIRDYCLTCEFANNPYADIVLVAFWKCKTESVVRNGNKGISLVLTNSQKGGAMVEAIRKNVALTVLDTAKASYNLRIKLYSEAFVKKREAFLQQCKEKGVPRLQRVCACESL